MFKKALLLLGLFIGMQSAYAELPSFNTELYDTGDNVPDKPFVLRDRFIEFHKARGFAVDSFTDLEGKPVPLESLRGNLVVLDIWATWCEPCIRLLPQMIELQKQLNNDGSKVKLVSVAIDKKLSRVTGFLKRHNIDPSFVTYYDPEQKIADAMPLDLIPSVFVLDGNGNLIGFVRGNLDWSDKEIPDYLHRLAKKYADIKPAAK